MAPVHEIIAELMRERGLDKRTCYTHVAALAPDGATIEVECSDAAVASELARRLALRAETSAVRVRTLPAPGQPELMLAVTGVGDVRREAAHTSELVSQLICGDVVAPLKREGDWVLGRLDDGYIGWIRDWHLKPWAAARRDAFVARATHRVRANHTQAFVAPGTRALPLTQLVVGTLVAPRSRVGRGWIEAELPDERVAFLRSADLEKNMTRRPTPKRLADTGLHFLGIPYLWGGSTPGGFDCSGLIQRVFRLHGVVLPRDSDMQARIGSERQVHGPAEVRPGDLLFFGKSKESITHVGLVLPDRTFLHAYGQVVVNSLDKSSDRYDERLASIWRMTRNPLARTRVTPYGP